MIPKVALTKQQEMERYYFEMFRKAYSLPSGNITYGDKPDVILTGNRRVGIEITRLFMRDGADSNSEQVQRKRRKAVISLAQELYAENGGTKIELTFDFNIDRPIHQVRDVANRIAELAQRAAQSDNGRLRRDAFEKVPELDWVYVYACELQSRDEPDPEFPDGQPAAFEDFCRFRSRQRSRALREGIYRPLTFSGKWRLGQTYQGRPMSVERLNTVIREKESKASHYARCDTYWLLVVADFADLAQEQEIRVDGLAVASDVFERIILYKPYFEHIVETTPTSRRIPLTSS